MMIKNSKKMLNKISKVLKKMVTLRYKQQVILLQIDFIKMKFLRIRCVDRKSVGKGKREGKEEGKREAIESLLKQGLITKDQAAKALKELQ